MTNLAFREKCGNRPILMDQTLFTLEVAIEPSVFTYWSKENAPQKVADLTA